ncbi:hypothetical protein BRD00_04335 [Halobacteriales archaeon QS_8_69_26]|nr:MAG: hypothetical protein BRD00_04335 [Halobacteriales archaeon QS_8_69_26]
MDVVDIEARIDEEKVVFHKPNNHGFVAVGEESIYVARDLGGEFEFEERERDAVRSILVEHEDEYEPPNHYPDDFADKVSDENRDYHAQIKITLSSKVVAVTVEESPVEVARTMLDADL